MSKILLVFLTLVVLAGCPNHLPEGGIPVNSHILQEAIDGPLIVQGDKKIPILAPVGFTEETILVRLTESADLQTEWTLNDSIKSHLEKDVTGVVGFGQLQNDIGQANAKYAISLPRKPFKSMWLHVTTGTEVGGVFKEGTLIDIFGNEYTVTNLDFYFHRQKRVGSIYDTNFDVGVKQDIVVESKGPSAATGQVMEAQLDGKYLVNSRIFDAASDNLRLQFYVKATIEDGSGYEQTLTYQVPCGVQFYDVGCLSYDTMFKGY